MLLLAGIGGAILISACDEAPQGATSSASPPSTAPSPTADPSPAEDPPGGRAADTDPLRAFHDDSWWNAPLPDDPPLNPSGRRILQYLSTARESGDGCLQLAGVGSSRWGQPIYDALPSDPVYDVRGINRERPPELKSLRIPRGARPADNSDASMTVYNRARGYVVALTGARYEEYRDEWSATGATVTYLDSNGLHVDTGRADDRRNRGTHRGNNGATMAVTRDEVVAGAVRHVLKVAVGPEASERHVFPMVGSDGDYTGDDPAVPPQGLRLRVKPSVDLDSLALAPEALVIARALQDYGFYIGDSGGRTAVKLENTVVQGDGVQWALPSDALCALPFTADFWDVLAEGYDPSRGGSS